MCVEGLEMAILVGPACGLFSTFSTEVAGTGTKQDDSSGAKVLGLSCLRIVFSLSTARA